MLNKIFAELVCEVSQDPSLLAFLTLSSVHSCIQQTFPDTPHPQLVPDSGC